MTATQSLRILHRRVSPDVDWQPLHTTHHRENELGRMQVARSATTHPTPDPTCSHRRSCQRPVQGFLYPSSLNSRPPECDTPKTGSLVSRQTQTVKCRIVTLNPLSFSASLDVGDMPEDGSRDGGDGGDGDNSSKIGEWRAIVTLIVFIITSMSLIHVVH